MQTVVTDPDVARPKQRLETLIDEGVPSVTRAQSQPSRPRAFTAFTDTTLPAAIDGSVTRGCATTRRCSSGSAALPYATMYDVIPVSTAGRHESVAAAAV